MSNKLPSAYQEIEYLESTGSQYIITDINLFDSKLIYDVTFSVTNNTAQRIFGNQVPYFYLMTNYYTQNRISLRIPEMTSYDISTQINTYQIYNVKLTDKKIYKDNTQIYTISSFNKSSMSKIHLFCYGTSSGTSGLANGLRIYNFKIINNDIIIYNYIPCYRKKDKKPRNV